MPQQTAPVGAVVPTFQLVNAPWQYVQSQGDFDLWKTDTADRVVTAVAWNNRRLVATKLTTAGKAALWTELGTYFTSGHLTTVQTAFTSLPCAFSDDYTSGWMVVDTASAATVIAAVVSALGNVA